MARSSVPCPKCSHRGGLTVESKQVGVVPWSVQAFRVNSWSARPKLKGCWVQATGRGGLEAFRDAQPRWWNLPKHKNESSLTCQSGVCWPLHRLHVPWLETTLGSFTAGTLNRCLMSDLCFSVGHLGTSNGFQRYSYIRIHSHLNTLNLTYAIPAILCPTDATNVLPATSKPI